jgi:hypothetical protein
MKIKLTREHVVSGIRGVCKEICYKIILFRITPPGFIPGYKLIPNFFPTSIAD